MTQKKKNLLEQDSTLRLIYAFNYFTDLNTTWVEESNVTMRNREISEKMGVSIDDAYFIFENRFYSINYHRSGDDVISCEVNEYDNFYDWATTILTMRFSFSISTKEISILDEVTKKATKRDEHPQKIMRAA